MGHDISVRSMPLCGCSSTAKLSRESTGHAPFLVFSCRFWILKIRSLVLGHSVDRMFEGSVYWNRSCSLRFYCVIVTNDTAVCRHVRYFHLIFFIQRISYTCTYFSFSAQASLNGLDKPRLLQLVQYLIVFPSTVVIWFDWRKCFLLPR